MAVLSAGQIARFRDDGFLVVPDLMGGDEIDRLAAAARSEFETQRHIGQGRRFPTPGKYTLSEDSLRLADVRRAVDHPQVTAAAAELLEDEIRMSAFVIYAMPPGSPGTGGDYQGTHESAHCDYKPYRPVGSSMRWLFAIVPLVDYTEQVGPLLVSPGSHRIPALARRGRITHVHRARGEQLRPFQDTRLRRGQVAFMDMFTWHQAFGNRSDTLRFGVYNKYRARSAPPGCGPYLFRERSADLFDAAGAALLADRIEGRVAQTRLLVEDDERFLVLDGADGSSIVPGGAAQPAPKRVGTDDDNVIDALMRAAGTQLGGDLPWVSYVGDHLIGDGSADVCRVYACPHEELRRAGGRGAGPVRWRSERWCPFDRLNAETGEGYLNQAAERWLTEPVVRGIGQSNAQAKVE